MAVMGKISESQQAKKQANAEAQAHEYNAAVSRNNAQAALNQSTAAQLAHRRKVEQVLGKQRAATAQAGLGFTGSAGDILDQSATLAELEG
jgi:hypothetical protein